ncbi:MAG: GIY-YIG nuclease family protein [Candidatus Diapherotrites archaeon]|nr:GIY-YIG nuclease family protein [Candidatus Micrarchaeota archaeon]MBU1939306.1 GIY-YIG nuclease family protein [Candidatus Micrarchaeota archaeon]
MAYFVYLLQCKDKTLYCGWTNDLKKRLAAHNAGKASRYTRARLPVKFVYSERKKSKSAALSRESEIKSWQRKKKLALISAQNFHCLGEQPPHARLP